MQHMQLIEHVWYIIDLERSEPQWLLNVPHTLILNTLYYFHRFPQYIFLGCLTNVCLLQALSKFECDYRESTASVV